MRSIRTYHEVPDPVGAEVLDQVHAQHARLERRLAAVQHVVAIASGKGGVGKSALTANLAAAIAATGSAVGAVDADLNGPSLARMLGAEDRPLSVTEEGVEPARGVRGIRLMSMDLLLAAEETPLRWREPSEGGAIWQSARETSVLREFLSDVRWGALDFLFIDVPPGTDKLHRLLPLLPAHASVMLVTIPSETSRFVVGKSVRFVQDAGARLGGLVANMGSYTCDACGQTRALFGADGAQRLAAATGVELLGEIPFDPELSMSTDAGTPLVLSRPDSPAARALLILAERVRRQVVS